MSAWLEAPVLPVYPRVSRPYSPYLPPTSMPHDSTPHLVISRFGSPAFRWCGAPGVSRLEPTLTRLPWAGGLLSVPRSKHKRSRYSQLFSPTCRLAESRPAMTVLHARENGLPSPTLRNIPSERFMHIACHLSLSAQCTLLLSVLAKSSTASTPTMPLT